MLLLLVNQYNYQSLSTDLPRAQFEILKYVCFAILKTSNRNAWNVMWLSSPAQETSKNWGAEHWSSSHQLRANTEHL